MLHLPRQGQGRSPIAESMEVAISKYAARAGEVVRFHHYTPAAGVCALQNSFFSSEEDVSSSPIPLWFGLVRRCTIYLLSGKAACNTVSSAIAVPEQ